MDIDQFLQGATPVFKKYIEDGLAELEQAAGRSGDSQVNKILSENRLTGKANGKQDADYWMDRLNSLKVIFCNYRQCHCVHINTVNVFILFFLLIVALQRGLPSQSESDHHVDNRSSVENLNVNALAQKASLLRKEV